MLTFYASNTKGSVPVDAAASDLPAHVSWIDAFDPTAEERSRLAALVRAPIPTLEELVEIETSSRLSAEGDALMMSLPATVKDRTGYPKATPIGFVVRPTCVVTVRFERLPSFEHLTTQLCTKGALPEGGIATTVMLIEIIIDHIADVLERIGSELDDMSRSVFASGSLDGKSNRPQRTNRVIAGLLKEVGRAGDLASKVSETLLGLSRMAPYILAKVPEVTPEIKGRIDTISADTHSLHEYNEHLSAKTQFLLDLLLGISNIEQNNVFRVLTVVSVIGIPPTFVASMYGMNFKGMPELEWTYGYAWGLSLIAISAIVPAVWFKIKGWW